MSTSSRNNMTPSSDPTPTFEGSCFLCLAPKDGELYSRVVQTSYKFYYAKEHQFESHISPLSLKDDNNPKDIKDQWALYNLALFHEKQNLDGGRLKSFATLEKAEAFAKSNPGSLIYKVSEDIKITNNLVGKAPLQYGYDRANDFSGQREASEQQIKIDWIITPSGNYILNDNFQWRKQASLLAEIKNTFEKMQKFADDVANIATKFINDHPKEEYVKTGFLGLGKATYFDEQVPARQLIELNKKFKETNFDAGLSEQRKAISDYVTGYNQITVNDLSTKKDPHFFPKDTKFIHGTTLLTSINERLNHEGFLQFFEAAKGFSDNKLKLPAIIVENTPSPSMRP